MTEEMKKIVGHKTFSDGQGGYRHEPLTQEEADKILAAVDADDKRLKELMPDVETALRLMTDAHYRLKQLGWAEAIYCPKDGSTFEVIEAGSSGIHKCHYEGEWPNGSWWVHEDGDLWPSHPILWRAALSVSESGLSAARADTCHKPGEKWCDICGFGTARATDGGK